MTSAEPDQTPKLAGASLILRHAVIAAILGGIVLLFAYVGGWLTPNRLTPAAIVNRFQQVNGPQPGFRRNHAKGVCVTGTFESNGKGADLSKASVFAPGRIPVVGRFAFAGGLPYVPDAPGLVRSLAVLFQLKDGEEWRVALINIPVFPVSTPQGFYDLLLASAPDPATGQPDPAKMKVFLGNNPETPPALQLIHNYPSTSGFADSAYHGLNAFRFIKADGTEIPVRWSLIPVQPAAPPVPASTTDKNYLFDALIKDIHTHPLQWRLVVTLGQPGDSTTDPTKPWPADRTQVEVGTLTIDQIESEDTSPTRDINFDPLILPDGIAASDDPILNARSPAYSKSFTRREGEPKQPSAVSPAETAK